MPIQAQLDEARKAGKKKRVEPAQPSCRGAHAAALLVTPQCPVHDRLGTHPNRDRFTVIDHKRAKQVKNCKPTPQEEKEEADKVLLKREPKSTAPGEW